MIVSVLKDNNIIEFLDQIYMKLRQWHYFENSDDFLKEHLTTLQIVKLCELVFIGNTPMFGYLLQTSCLLSFVYFTLLTEFSNLW